MRRPYAIPFISALVGGGVVALVVALAGGLSGNQKTVTAVQQVAPLTPSNASQETRPATPHDIYVRTAPGVVFITSTIVQKGESPFGLFGGG